MAVNIYTIPVKYDHSVKAVQLVWPLHHGNSAGNMVTDIFQVDICSVLVQHESDVLPSFGLDSA